jgi:hypothetical protein
MAKRVFIVHGWGGSPKREWFPWAKAKLEKRGFEVHIPQMPDPNHPKIEPWIAHLKEEVGNPGENTILVGHSVGCQTILRYLQTLPEKQRVGKVIFIAGWERLYLDDPAEASIAIPWLESPIDHETAKKRAASFTAVFSDNDPYVPFEENANIFREKLGAKIILEKQMGHFNDDFGINEIPVLLELIK